MDLPTRSILSRALPARRPAGERRRLAGVARALLVALLISSPALAHEEVESACRAVILDYAYYRDRLDADALADLFTADATLEIMGSRIQGRAAIRQRLRDAGNGPLTRHLISNVRVSALGDGRARGVSYVAIYEAPRPRHGGAALSGDFPVIGEYHDLFVQTEQGWKIAERRFQPVLLPSRHQPASPR